MTEIPFPSLLARVLYCFGSLLRRTGMRGMRRLAAALGALLWFCLPGRRRFAAESIAEHLGVSEAEAWRIARQSFTENACSFLETAMAPLFGLSQARIPNPEALAKLTSGDRPVVAASAHIGAWELMAGVFGDFPEHYPHVVVVRKYKNQAMDDFTNRMRGSRGTLVLGHREATFSILRALKKNGVVAFLVDHNTSRSEAVFLPFLGESAAVNRGPALLAARAEALVFGVYLLREGDGYAFHVEELLDAAKLEGDTEAKTLAVAQAYTEAMERAVRLAPEQWFWMHKRWKTRPDSEETACAKGAAEE